VREKGVTCDETFEASLLFGVYIQSHAAHVRHTYRELNDDRSVLLGNGFYLIFDGGLVEHDLLRKATES
jgi:hypothetical protein